MAKKNERELAEQVIEIIIQQLFPLENWEKKKEEITEATLLQDDLGADSLDLVEIIMALEDEFGVEIPDEDWSEVKLEKLTVGHVIKVAEQRLGGRGSDHAKT